MSDKHKSKEAPLPDPELVNQTLENVMKSVQERRGLFTALGILLIAAITGALIAVNLDPDSGDTEFARLWDLSEPIRAQYERDLTAGAALGKLDDFISEVRGTKTEGQALWLAAIYNYREANTSDKVTYEDRRPFLEKAKSHLVQLKDPRFGPLDLLITTPGWFTGSGDSPDQALLEQIEADTKWWSEHAYKEPIPDAARVAVLRTDLGDIHLQFFAELAGGHADQFVKLCQLGAYNGTAFHFARGGNLTPISVMGGDPYSFFYNDPLDEKHILRWGKGGLGVDTPPAESRFQINHLPTIVTSARAEKADWDNGIQFQILLQRDPSLDRVHTPFAKVVEGMSVVEAIAKRKTAADHEPFRQNSAFTGPFTRDLFVEPVVIEKAIVYQDGKALEHEFDLTDGEKTLGGLAGSPVKPLMADKLYGGRRLRSVHEEGAGVFGIEYPFPDDMDPEKADPKGDRK